MLGKLSLISNGEAFCDEESSVNRFLLVVFVFDCFGFEFTVIAVWSVGLDVIAEVDGDA